MDFAGMPLEELVPLLDIKRRQLNLSYQNVADACNVSQRTIMRVFKGQQPPAYDLLQHIVSALEMDFVQAPIAPQPSAADDYVDYLKRLIDFERSDKKIRLDQQEARHNRHQNALRRVLIVVIGICAVLGLFICGLFTYDLMHRDRGWIQGDATPTITAARGLFLAVRSWWHGLWM